MARLWRLDHEPLQSRWVLFLNSGRDTKIEVERNARLSHLAVLVAGRMPALPGLT